MVHPATPSNPSEAGWRAPLVIDLDNASIHVSHVVKEALPDLATEDLTLFYLPPDSPRLNDIEAYFRGAKHSD